jgi:hypothetical protein
MLQKDLNNKQSLKFEHSLEFVLATFSEQPCLSLFLYYIKIFATH